MGNTKIAWEPEGYHSNSSNIANFMEEYGYERYEDLIPESELELARFWESVAEDVGIVWRDRYDEVVDMSAGPAFSDWFSGGRLNATETMLDQWADRTPDRPMYVWENEQGGQETVTYAEMRRRTDRFANALRSHGVGRGDVVGITFPMHPNGFVASLAALRIGAAFIQIFPGYGADAMGRRLDDAGAVMMIAADGYTRNGSVQNLFQKVDTATASTSTVETVVVYEHLGLDRTVSDTPVVSWEDFTAESDAETDVAVLDASEMAFIAYSSGTTGEPKGTIHTHASLLAMGNKEGAYHFDLGEGDTLLWVTDFGWIIVPIWMLAGGPALGATVVLLEGSPTEPDKNRVWQTIEDCEITTFGISPSGARSLQQHTQAPRDAFDLDSLRILASTGEPWSTEGWEWFFDAVGGSELPIINASGGTELAGAILSPTPRTPLKPGTLYGPAPGVAANIYDEDGTPVEEGYLVVELPIPGMTHGLTSGDERYLQEYWEDFKGVWNQNDLAKRDADGFWFITGRADDTMNVSGRRITAPAIEESVAAHPAVTEVAVISVPSDDKGQAPVAFVTVTGDETVDPAELELKIREQVADRLGSPFRPQSVHIVPAIPRTQTGKTPRSVLRSVYLGKGAGNVSTLDRGEVLREFPRHKEPDT